MNTNTENPYQAPQSDLIQAESGAAEIALQEPQSRSIGDGWRWIANGFRLFKQAPGTWIGMGIVTFILLFACVFIPILGFIVLALLFPVIIAGYMQGCHSLAQGEQMEFNHLFAGFKTNTKQLILFGGLYLLLSLIVSIPMMVSMGSTFMQLIADPGNAELAEEMVLGPEFWLGYLLSMALSIPLIMCYWFTPALISLHDVPAVQAMKMSFKGCLKNILPFLWYGILGIILYIISAIPLGLGLFIFLPTIVASLYTSYRAVFTEGL